MTGPTAAPADRWREGSARADRCPRVAAAHLAVVGGGLATYVVVRLFGVGTLLTAAVAGRFVAAGLLTGMLLDGWLGGREERVRRTALPLATAAVTVVLVVALEAIARTMHFASVTPDDWVEHAALNALSTAVLLHVAIGRRWPFVRQDDLAVRR